MPAVSSPAQSATTSPSFCVVHHPVRRGHQRRNAGQAPRNHMAAAFGLDVSKAGYSPQHSRARLREPQEIMMMRLVRLGQTRCATENVGALCRIAEEATRSTENGRG